MKSQEGEIMKSMAKGVLGRGLRNQRMIAESYRNLALLNLTLPPNMDDAPGIPVVSVGLIYVLEMCCLKKCVFRIHVLTPSTTSQILSNVAASNVWVVAD